MPIWKDSTSTNRSSDEPKFRKHPAHGVLERIDQPTIVFLTVCTRNRKPWLVMPGIHDLLRSAWLQADAWKVGRYVLMPDHLHLFASPDSGKLPLDNWVRYWKSQVTRTHLQPEYQWQTDHWDTRMRSANAYAEKWEYVRLNPVRGGLVTDPDE